MSRRSRGDPRPVRWPYECAPLALADLGDWHLGITTSTPTMWAWLEDHRRESNGALAWRTLGLALRHPVSGVWKGYWQRLLTLPYTEITYGKA
jgi:hypothetical protein